MPILVERGIVSEADMDTCVKWGIGYKADAGQLGMKTLGGISPYTAEQVAERRAEIAKGLIAVRKTLSAL